jgi:hypothetical protein
MKQPLERDFEKTLKHMRRAAMTGFIVYATVVLGIISTLGYVAYHFLAKVW